MLRHVYLVAEDSLARSTLVSNFYMFLLLLQGVEASTAVVAWNLAMRPRVRPCMLIQSPLCREGLGALVAGKSGHWTCWRVADRPFLYLN